MTKPQLALLAAAILMICTGLYFIASQNYAFGGVYAGVGAVFASLSSVLGGVAKAKEQQKDEADAG